MRDVPLSGQDKVVVAHFLEIALLPFAAIDEGYVLLFEMDQRVWFGKIREDRVGVLFGVANDIGHSRLLPTGVELRMAGLAAYRADVLRLTRGRSRLLGNGQQRSC